MTQLQVFHEVNIIGKNKYPYLNEHILKDSESSMKHNKFVSEGERESFIKTLEEMKSRAVIVEGKKDVKALAGLGLTNIIPLNNTPLAEFANNIAESGIHEVIILTDFDKEGRKLEKKLDVLLKSHKVRVNRRLRRILMGFGKGCIEDFKSIKI